MTETDFDAIVENRDDITCVRSKYNTRSNTGNMERLKEQHGDAIRFALGVSWLGDDGTRWVPDPSIAFRAAQETAKSIYGEAAAAYALLSRINNKDQYKEVLAMAKALAEHARASENRSNIEDTLKVAANNPPFRIDPSALDSQFDLLGTPNGTVMLPTPDRPGAVLRPHDPADLITMQTAVPYDPDATAPHFEADLHRFLKGDTELIGFLARNAGQALYGLHCEQISLSSGKGGNYKSTFQAALREAMGDYAYKTDPDLLVAGKGKKSVSDKGLLAELRGKRLVITSETDADQALAEGMIKLLTEDKIRAEFKHQTGFEYSPVMTIMVSTNHKPTVSGTDDGIWRRFNVIEWEEKIPEEEQDEHYFKNVIRDELPGVLAWMVRGAEDYAARGMKLDPPEKVQAWSQAYRAQNDLVVRWLAEECKLGEDEEATRTELWTSFTEFVKAERGRVPKESEWRNRLQDAGITSERQRLADDSRPTVYRGVRLLQPKF